MPVPEIVVGEQATAGLKRGFDRLTNLLELTLGPTQGLILSEKNRSSQPELLTDAATIARRIVALPNRAEDIGAMLARNLVWRMHQRVGDGSATTAVLARAILDQASRYVAAGGNPMLLRRGIDRAIPAAIQALRQMARPVQSESVLGQVALTISGEEKLSAILGEMFQRLGSDAHVLIEDYAAPYLERQYYEGGRWKARLASPYFVSETATRRAMIQEAHVVLYAGDLKTVEEVEPVLKIVGGTPWHQLALIAHEISGPALTTLVLNHQQGRIKIMAVELREPHSKRQLDLEDLAVLTGATVMANERGKPIARIEPPDIGAAPRVEGDAEELIVVGGEGDPADVERARQALRARIAALPETDEELGHLRFRLARFSGQIAKLMIGAYTESERSVIHEKAEKAIRALPLALREGVVPGGGRAYLDCIPAVRAVQAQGDEAYGIEIVARALEEPFRRIAANAGAPAPAALMAEAQRRGPGWGWDALTGQMVSLEAAGIIDPSVVLREALQTAASGAVMALTTEALVLKRNPDTTFEP